MATIRVSEKEAIERGWLKPADATDDGKVKKVYIRVPVPGPYRDRIRYKLVGPNLWNVVIGILMWLLGFTMAIHHMP